MTENVGHDTASEVMTWLEGLKNGHDTEVMARGKHFYFNCDGINHYVYEVDESRREVKKNGKLGRKKRAYVGAIAKARQICPTEAAQWEHRHTCHDQSESHDRGRSLEPVGKIAGHPVFVVRE